MVCFDGYNSDGTYLTPVVSGKFIKNQSDAYARKAEPLVVAVNSIPFGEFVTRPAMFMITDDLVITPLSFISCISFLEKENIPMDDIEVRSVNVGQEEALRLLEASLTSKSALSTAFINSSKIDINMLKQEK
ncbi:hypothetical protein GIB67_007674 [Kingdonia uniflora]|uniref:Uncharacterized protein n=1 Tax=Kingdonia uniflora TaxID=39325 RepID=A0A7J7N1M6_9MAGN|nr:hypothetical protein GIB67_007674 [Kingdonia uniflora]